MDNILPVCVIFGVWIAAGLQAAVCLDVSGATDNFAIGAMGAI